MINHIYFWLVITILSVFLTPLFVNKHTYGEMIQIEQHRLIEELGTESGGKIIMRADETYKSLFERSGIQEWALSHYKAEKKHNDLLSETPAEKALKHSEQYVLAFFMNIYEGIFRLTQLLYWFSYAAPFLIAAAIDGAMQRKVKIATFHYSSPAVYNTMWHVMIGLFFLTLIYCDSPLPITPMVFPALLLFISLMVRAMLANLQRSA